MKPNYDKELFKIEIIIHENAQSFNVKSLDGSPISYQQVIGALETVKLHYVFDQSGINAEEYRKWQAKQKGKKDKKTNLQK